MTRELMQRELVISLATGEFQVLPITDPRIIGPVDYGWVRFNEERQAAGRPDPDILTWGGGPLAASRIPGARRLVFCGYSPSWEGFYISSFGGGAYVMHRIGADFVCLKGSAPQDSVLILNHSRGEISVRLEPIDPDVIWAGYAPAPPPGGELISPQDVGARRGLSSDDDYLIGFYALQQAVLDRYRGEYREDWVRVFAVGPASRHSDQGIIGSNQVKKGRILPIDDWAGRGGLGSRLLQRHRIAACIFGGDWEDPDLRDSKEIDSYFMANYGQPMIKVDLGATEKYRYVPGFQTGGTFGVNYHTVDARLLSFNWRSVYQPEAARLAQHTAFVREHYLKQFNEEIIQPKHFAHCGEPCSVACKKYDRIYKKDYEPYQALGPQCGIFDQRAAEELNHFVDAMGVDAIQMGGVVSWIMELVHDGLIVPDDFGFPPADEMRFDFASDPRAGGSNPPAEVEKAPQGLMRSAAEAASQLQAGGLQPLIQSAFDLELDSRRNADYAYQVVFALLFDSRCAVFRRGIRAAAKALDERDGRALDAPASFDSIRHTTPDSAQDASAGIESRNSAKPPFGTQHATRITDHASRIMDHAVYTAHGPTGSMVPNQYWVPGMLAPMPMMGKYFVYYGLDFLPPAELGKKCVERFVYELFNENSGVCRFHRKWAEVIVDEIVSSHYHFPVDYKAHQFALAKQIYELDGAAVAPWETERTVDAVWQYLEEIGGESPKDDLRAWVERFRADKWAAARAYWDELRVGIAEAFAAGPDAIPDQRAPGPAAKVDVMGQK